MELSFSYDVKMFYDAQKGSRSWNLSDNSWLWCKSWFVMVCEVIKSKTDPWHSLTDTCYGHWKLLWSVIGYMIEIFVNLKDWKTDSWQCDLVCKKKTILQIVLHLQIKTTHVYFHCHWTLFQGTQETPVPWVKARYQAVYSIMLRRRCICMAFPHACSNPIEVKGAEGFLVSSSSTFNHNYSHISMSLFLWMAAFFVEFIVNDF